MTNADRIRNMNNEELAKFLLKVSCAYSNSCLIIDEDCKYFPDVQESDDKCESCFKEWLSNNHIER